MLLSALPASVRDGTRRRRKRVTLIAAVRCDDGIAIAADAQETVGPHRRSVQKIAPFEFANCKVIIAGAGNGDLIYAFRTFLQTKFPPEGVNGIVDFVPEMETILREFYGTVVGSYSGDNKDLYLFVAASIAEVGQYDAWLNNNTCVLSRLDTSALIGWDETLYYRNLAKLSSPHIPLAHAVLVAVHTLVVAEDMATYVQGPMSVSVVSRRGIFEELETDVKAVTERLRDYEDRLQHLFLLYSDVTTSSIKFKEQLEEFSKSAVALRETHVEAEINRLFEEGFDSRNWAYDKFPRGVTVAMSNDGISVLQGEARREHYKRHGIDVSKLGDALAETRRMEWNALPPQNTEQEGQKDGSNDESCNNENEGI